jgi:hypothetical protein
VENVGKLIELSGDRTLRTAFKEECLSGFWLHAAAEYPRLSDEAVSVLLPFSTTYLCENGFSAMTAIKTKYRNQLCVNNDLRMRLTNINPRIDLLLTRMQAQPSH